MARSDVTAAFILTSSIAILASAQELSGHNSLLPPGTTHLAGHGFIGTLTSLVASSQLDLPTAVRLAVCPLQSSFNNTELINSAYTLPYHPHRRVKNQRNSRQQYFQLDSFILSPRRPKRYHYQMKNRITRGKGLCN